MSVIVSITLVINISWMYVDHQGDINDY